MYPEGVYAEIEQDLFKNILENSEFMISSAIVSKLEAVICKWEYSSH